jgi:hypothetical protein
MKIAICLSGQPRFLEKGYINISNKILSSNNDFDFFIHTWWSSDLINQKSNRNYTFEDNSIEMITNLYKPKGFINQPQKMFNIKQDVDYETLNPISPYSMFYSIKIANYLKSFFENENNFKYDLVIRCRFDILLENINLNFDKINDNEIYLDTVGSGFPNDQFAISNSKTMDYYCSLYDNLELYYKEGVRNFVGERILRYHLEKGNIKMIFSDKVKNNIIKL